MMNDTGATAAVHADPDLDRDLAVWRAAADPALRICVLGPVQVDGTSGAGRSAKAALLTELAVYLACHPAGATYHHLAQEVFGRSPRSARDRTLISQLRRWLGVDVNGEWHVPRLAHADGRLTLRGALVDADLFSRLRQRGTAHGEGGIEDLWAALQLVTGVPFSDGRPLGYGWLRKQLLDQHDAAMIVDVAHIVAAHHLAAGEPERASAAAQVGLLAGSADDVPLLDLLAAYDAQHLTAEANVVAARILAYYDAEIEEDLPPSIYQAIRHRRFVAASTGPGGGLACTRAAKREHIGIGRPRRRFENGE